MPNQLESTQRVMLSAAKHLCLLATSLAMIAGTAPAAPNPGGNRQRDVFGGYTSTQIVVKLRPEAVATPAARRHFRTAPHDADPRAALSGELRTAATNWRARRMRPAYSEPFADPALAAHHGLDRTFVIEVPQGTDTAAMAAAFAGLDRDVEVAAVDGIGGVADPVPLIPNDTNFNLQYAMRNTGQTGGTPGADIDATAAWGLHTGDFGSVTIAIIDSGVNSHLDFGTRLIPGHNTDNALMPDLTTDGCPHGTHVAGIAAASGNNNRGVAGVTWGAYIMPVRVLGTPNGCSGSIRPLANGIIWAADHGAQIGNISLQYYNLTVEEGIILQDAINYANDLGMLLIAAAGNTNLGPANPAVVAYPARLLGCMGVTATDHRDAFASTFSRYGNEVDVCAPGKDIYSTWPTNSYIYSSGTSMATPHVSGLAALVKSYVPALTNVDIEMILDATVDDLGTVGWDDHYGFGRINAYQALVAAGAWRGILSSSPPNGAIDARRPIDPEGVNAYGWQAVELTFDRGSQLRTASDFSVTQEGGISVAPPIMGVAAADEQHVTVTLERIIETRAWTTVSHILSNTRVRLGYLPGDVTVDGVSNDQDIVALMDSLDGTGGSRPVWSLDIDRSEAVTPADILEVADLLNGAGAYEAFLGATLP